MSKRIKLVNILKEGFKDDAAADLKIDPIQKAGGFISLISTVATAKDLSRAIEAFIKAVLESKPELAKSIEDSRFKQIIAILNQAQGDPIKTLSPTQTTKKL